MSDSPLPSAGLLATVLERLNRLKLERAGLLARLAEIDAALTRAAEGLGISPEELIAPTELVEPKVDGRRAGSMMEHVLLLIGNAPSGITRGGLKAILREHHEFGEKVRRNENGFYNAVKRALARREIVERDGHLYIPAKAPLEGQEPALSSPNVTLFDRGARDA